MWRAIRRGWCLVDAFEREFLSARNVRDEVVIDAATVDAWVAVRGHSARLARPVGARSRSRAGRTINTPARNARPPSLLARTATAVASIDYRRAQHIDRVWVSDLRATGHWTTKADCSVSTRWRASWGLLTRNHVT